MNFVQEYFEKEESLPKYGKIKACKKKIHVDVDVFQFQALCLNLLMKVFGIWWVLLD